MRGERAAGCLLAQGAGIDTDHAAELVLQPLLHGASGAGFRAGCRGAGGTPPPYPPCTGTATPAAAAPRHAPCHPTACSRGRSGLGAAHPPNPARAPQAGEATFGWSQAPSPAPVAGGQPGVRRGKRCRQQDVYPAAGAAQEGQGPRHPAGPGHGEEGGAAYFCACCRACVSASSSASYSIVVPRSSLLTVHPCSLCKSRVSGSGPTQPQDTGVAGTALTCSQSSSSRTVISCPSAPTARTSSRSQ